MTGSKVAKRYALALFQVAKDHQLVEKMEEELRAVKEVFYANNELKAVLITPKLSKEKKKEILSEAFASMDIYVKNTLMLLLDRHRVNEMIEVVDEFLELANEEKGILTANVYSIRPLTSDERDALSSSFAEKVGKKSLQIENIVDSDLLGGVKLRIGNRIYDGSLRGKLERLERKLLG